MEDIGRRRCKILAEEDARYWAEEEVLSCSQNNFINSETKMSFPHSKRADNFAGITDNPGPNSYDIKVSLVSEDKNKNFGFINKSKRFRSPKGKSEEVVLDELSIPSSAPVPIPSQPATRMHRVAGQVLEASRWKKEADKWQEQYEKQAYNHQKDIHNLEERLSKLDLSLKETLKEKNALASAVTSREKELLELSHKHAMLKSNLEKTEKVSISFAEKATRSNLLEKKLTDLEKVTAKTRSIVDKKSSSLEKLQSERTELLESIEELKKQIEGLSNVERERDELLELSEASKREFDLVILDLESSMQKLENEKSLVEKALHESISSLESRICDLSDKNLALQSDFSNVTCELEALQKEKIQTSQILSGLDNSIEALKESMAILESEKSSWLEERKTYELQISEFVTSLAKKDAGIFDLNSEKSSLLKMIEDLKAQDEDNVSRIDALNSQMAEKDSHLISLSELYQTEQKEYTEIISKLQEVLAKSQTDRDNNLLELSEKLNEITSNYENALLEIQNRDSKIAQISQEEEDLRLFIENLKSEFTRVFESQKDLEMRANDLEHEKIKLLDTIASTEEELSFSRNELFSVKSSYSAAQIRIKDLESEIARCNTALDESHSALKTSNLLHNEGISRYQEQIEELLLRIEEERHYRDGERDMAELRIETVKAQCVDDINQQQTVIVSMEETIASLGSDLIAKQNELDEFLESHKAEVSRLKYEIKEHEDLIDQFRESVTDSQITNEENLMKIESLENQICSDNAKYKSEIQKMESAFKMIIREFEDKLENNNAEKDSVIRDLENRCIHLDQSYSSEVEALNLIVSERSSAVAALDQKILDLKKSFDELSSLNNDLKLDNAEKQNRIVDLELENVVKSDSLCTLSKDLDTSKARFDVLLAQFTESESSASKLTNELLASNSELEKSCKSISELKNLLDSQNHNLELKVSEINDLSYRLHTQAEELKEFHTDYAMLEAKLAEESTSKAELTLKMTFLEKSNKDLIDEIANLNEIIENERKAHEATCASLNNLFEIEKHNVIMERRRSDDLSASLSNESGRTLSLSRDIEDLSTRLNEQIGFHNDAVRVRDEIYATLEEERAANIALKTSNDELMTLLEEQKKLSQKSEAALTEERERYQLNLSELSSKNSDLVAKLNDSNAVITSLNSDLLQLQSNLKESHNEANDKHVEYSKYYSDTKAKMASLTAALEGAIKANSVKDDNILSLKLQVSDLTSKYDTSILNLENIKTKITEQEGDKILSAETITELKNRIEELSKTLNENEVRLRLAEAENVNSKVSRDSEIKQLKTRNELLESRVQHQANELSIVNYNNENLVSAENELRSLKLQMEQVLSQAHSEKRGYEESLENIRADLEALRQENSRLSKDFADSEERKTEVEETLRSQVEYFSTHYKEAFEKMKSLSSESAQQVFGHQNSQQKIRHIGKLKEELLKIRQDLSITTRERDALKRRNLQIERDLEAFKAVAPSVYSHSAKGAVLLNPSSVEIVPKRRVSRVERHVLGVKSNVQASVADISEVAESKDNFLDSNGKDVENDPKSFFVKL